MKKGLWRAVGVVSLSILSTALLVAETKPTPKANKPAKVHVLAAAETINGTIASVDTTKRLIVLKDSTGTPFDFVVTPRTRIESSNQQIKMQDLSSRTNAAASVKFVPMRKGDMARTIDITG